MENIQGERNHIPISHTFTIHVTVLLAIIEGEAERTLVDDLLRDHLAEQVIVQREGLAQGNGEIASDDDVLCSGEDGLCNDAEASFAANNGDHICRHPHILLECRSDGAFALDIVDALEGDAAQGEVRLDVAVASVRGGGGLDGERGELSVIRGDNRHDSIVEQGGGGEEVAGNRASCEDTGRNGHGRDGKIDTDAAALNRTE